MQWGSQILVIQTMPFVLFYWFAYLCDYNIYSIKQVYLHDVADPISPSIQVKKNIESSLFGNLPAYFFFLAELKKIDIQSGAFVVGAIVGWWDDIFPHPHILWIMGKGTESKTGEKS